MSIHLPILLRWYYMSVAGKEHSSHTTVMILDWCSVYTCYEWCHSWMLVLIHYALFGLLLL